ncbi:MAG: arginyltransferase [Desulfobulbaceae bacterium]|nr:arginyltransferase [Desulfobulbaceae bacterium]
MSDLKRSYGPEDYSISEYLTYFYDIGVECPYGIKEKAVYRQQQFVSLPDPLLAKFLRAGFRRNGNTLYTMVCPDCRKCTPIRLHPEEFKANRNQKRVFRKNEDLDITMNVLKITEEKLALCSKFLEERYPGKGNSAVGYYGTFFANSITSTLEIEYRSKGKLIGVGIVDIGTDWLNAVYNYFDPDEAKRSPGTFNILYLVELCRKNKIPNFYLGYLIREVRAMSYKKNFKPHYLLIDGQWKKYNS